MSGGQSAGADPAGGMMHFIEHRREVVTRRTNFELKKAVARAHILEGLKIALDWLDAVIELIRESKTPAGGKGRPDGGQFCRSGLSAQAGDS